MGRSSARRRLALARAIVEEPWTDGPDPPPPERGAERERRQLRLPPWMWRDVEAIAHSAGMSRDEVLQMVVWRYLRDANLPPR
jgi:hypothetical protein